MNFNPGCTQRTHGDPRAGSGLSPSQGPGSGAGALGCAVGSPGPPALLPRTPHISRIPHFSRGRILLWGYSPKPNSFLDAWIFFPFPLPLSFFIFKPKRKPTQNENCEPAFLEENCRGGATSSPSGRGLHPPGDAVGARNNPSLSRAHNEILGKGLHKPISMLLFIFTKRQSGGSLARPVHTHRRSDAAIYSPKYY